MGQILVRNLDDDVKDKLARRARRHGRSTEEEVREILRNAVSGEGGAPGPLGTRIASRFAGIGFDGAVEEHRGQPALPPELPE